MNMINNIFEAMATDDNNTEKQNTLLIERYLTANEYDKKTMDEVIVMLCGWSLKTLLEQASIDIPSTDDPRRCDLDYGEDVAAIAAIVHEKPDDYKTLFEKSGDKLGGHVGIWSFCADAAKVFSQESEHLTAGEDYQWVDAIEDFSNVLVGYLLAGDVPSIEKMHLYAGGCIERSKD